MRIKSVHILCTLLVFSMGFITGCGRQESPPADESAAEAGAGDSSVPESRNQPEEAKVDSAEEQEVSQQESTEATLPEEIDRTAVFELLSGMNVGWNLGNTLDAHGAGNSLSAETYWGNPETTREMIDAIAAQGFNTIRVPVTWAEHVGTAPDYAINEEWMNRVEEVVGYCLNNDMYVILNTHHEPDFWLKPDAEHQDSAKAELVAIWKQVSERFKDYDNHLLFEGMNEPRIKGSEKEWNGGTEAERAVVYELNQAFVDTVRATGGNNEDRCLIICAYGNSPGYTAVKELQIPQDNHIAVAVHMYTPYVFCYEADNGNLTTWDGNLKEDIVATVKVLDQYLIQNDIPVIVTEFGAVNKDNTEEILKWLADYMGTMNRYGIKCVWWDNGNYTNSGEKFGIFDRRNCSWFSQEIADALIQNSVTAE